jgi:threonine/homoserine/homoserine lactone efflux protein
MEFLKGALIGFSIAAPVGPIGLLCLRRAMCDGKLAGFVSGLGAALADAIYGLVAVLGLGVVTALLLEHERWLRLGGGLYLVWLGWVTVRQSGPSADTNRAQRASLTGAFFSTFLLTLTNPMTVVSFLGIFAGAGASPGPGGMRAGALMVAGVFAGSAAWWLLLSVAAGWFGGRLAAGRLGRINLVSGIVIAGIGVWQLASIP